MSHPTETSGGPAQEVREGSRPAADRVSAVVYSRNEAELLPACLGALDGFGEVVVCSMQSTDATAEVAARFGARVVDVPDARVIEEVRQLGLDAAAREWVLFVDADEILPAGYAQHVRQMVEHADRDGTAAYRLRYANVAFGRTLTSTLVGSAKYALMRRSATRYPEVGRAHVPPRFDGPAQDAPPSVPEILHLNFRAADQMVEKVLRYAPDAPGPASLLRPTALIRELARATIFSGSWRDGSAGVAVTTSAVVGRWYGALLEADRGGRLGSDLPPSEERILGAVTAVQLVYQRAKYRIRQVAERRPGRQGRA